MPESLNPAPRRPGRRPSIDGIRRRTAPAQAAVPGPVQASAGPQPAIIRPRPVRRPQAQQAKPKPAPAVQPRVTIPPVPPARKSIWKRMQTPVIIMAGMLAGFGIQTLAFGLVAIAVYAIAALAWKIYSRTTFTLALIALLAVPIILVARQNAEVASNFATYTFLLIVIGILSLVRESPESGRRYLHAKKRASKAQL